MPTAVKTHAITTTMQEFLIAHMEQMRLEDASLNRRILLRQKGFKNLDGLGAPRGVEYREDRTAFKHGGRILSKENAKLIDSTRDLSIQLGDQIEKTAALEAELMDRGVHFELPTSSKGAISLHFSTDAENIYKAKSTESLLKDLQSNKPTHLSSALEGHIQKLEKTELKAVSGMSKMSSALKRIPENLRKPGGGIRVFWTGIGAMGVGFGAHDMIRGFCPKKEPQTGQQAPVNPVRVGWGAISVAAGLPTIYYALTHQKIGKGL